MQHEESRLQIDLVSKFRLDIENNTKPFKWFKFSEQFYESLHPESYITSNKNEEKCSVQASVRLNKMGRKPGEFDLIVYYKNKVYNIWSFFYIELKTIKNFATKDNGLNDNQIKFKAECDAKAIKYYVVSTPQQFLEILEKEKIIQKI